MTYTNAGLKNNGKTTYFTFFYDDSLSFERGQYLTNELMDYCDRDFLLVSSWFTGVSVGTPINVYVRKRANQGDGGASWFGLGVALVPLEITLKLGEEKVISTTPLLYLRFLMVAETSEIFMRERQPAWFNRYNDWFDAFNEGNKGEALSCFLAAQLIVNELGRFSRLPESVYDGQSYGYYASSKWLNSTRQNYLNVSNDQIEKNENVGCNTLFLFYLHDQLGYSINDIVNHGGETLAKVYSNLTGDSKENAWNKFIDLVNLYCPSNQMDYDLPSDNIFPLADLDSLDSPKELSWVRNGDPKLNRLWLYLNRTTAVSIKIKLESDNATVLSIAQNDVIIPNNEFSHSVQLNVKPQNSLFRPTQVTITANYAGKTLKTSIMVVPPELLTLPPLEIVPKPNDNPCAQPFVEGSSQGFVIKNLDVIYDQTGLNYEWTVNGKIVGTKNTSALTINPLPPSGTKVTIAVKVQNASKIQATGEFEFTTVQSEGELEQLIRQVDCYIKDFRNMNMYIPPWVPIEVANPELYIDQLDIIEDQSKKIIDHAQKAIATIAKIKSFKSQK